MTHKRKEKKRKKKKSLTCDIKSVMCAKKKEAEQTSGVAWDVVVNFLTRV